MSYSTNKINEGPSTIHGVGCVAATNIWPGEIVGVFTGEYFVTPMEGELPIYPEDLDWRYCIDAAVTTYRGERVAIVVNPISGDKTAIDRINHSDSPNCKCAGLAVVAAEPLQRGEELTIDYQHLDATPLVFPSDHEGNQ